MPARSLKIVSGGQTGADRGALDAALAAGVPCGGWCPEGRLDENGRIPPHYPLTELPGGGFQERTIRNVQDSDGTLVIYFERLSGGTETTVGACREHGKPHLLLDGTRIDPEQCIESVARFLTENNIRVLNVAGPRASEEIRAYGITFQVIGSILRQFTGSKNE